MNEALLHYVWKFRLFNQTNLTTTTGEQVEIIKPGEHNRDAGPDFLNARVKIGNTLWAGNIEIHINSSDWKAHHTGDKAYDNVILHVVYKHKGETTLSTKGGVIPVLEIGALIDNKLLSRYDLLSQQNEGIRCSSFLGELDDMSMSSWLSRVAIERLEGKVAVIEKLLELNTNDWENVAFQMIARYLGAGINREPFEWLARSLPVKVWAKHVGDPLSIEALVFGQAGFLSGEVHDTYPKTLKKEYNYLKRLHSLTPMDDSVWKFLRLRPANFPTLRLAQLAAIMVKDAKLFNNIILNGNEKSILAYLDIDVSAYWKTHSKFDAESKVGTTALGKSTKNILLINAVAPLLFTYGKYKGNETFCDRAIELLEAIKPESNAIIGKWKEYNIKPANAFNTQALLQLSTAYCDKFKCVECGWGNRILR
jgi:hypothetical protein